MKRRQKQKSAPHAKFGRRPAARKTLAARAHAAPRTFWVIPKRWLNNALAIFLLAPAWLLSKTFLQAFSRAAFHERLWASAEFWFFSLGAVLWVLWFFGSIWAMGDPRPLRVYVFGHELTHAIWVWAMGGRVDLSRFKVSRDGGQVVVSKHNFLIALAPYFYPLYTLVVVAIYGIASLFYNVADEKVTFLMLTPLHWMFAAIGFTWAFHFTFTCWMIPKGQSDLTYHGTFFSLMVIYIMNLFVITLFLIIAAPEISFLSFGRELLVNVEDFCEVAWGVILRTTAVLRH